MFLRILKKLFMIECPNCASAWTGGDPNPQDRTFCLLCSDKTGKITGYIWRWSYLNRRTVNRNLEIGLDKRGE